MGKQEERFVAFLRAINVGKRQIKMDRLTKIVQDAGMTEVKTLIASGNVVFTATEGDPGKLESILEEVIRDAVGFDVDVMVRTIDRVKQLLELNPFPAELDDDTHAYVTFLKNLPDPERAKPYENVEERYAIVLVDEADVFCMASMLPSGVRGDFGKYLTKSFGKLQTTRNWNTVVKLAAM